MSTIFDLLVDPLSLSLSPIWEWMILLIIGELAYVIAFRVVGNIYDGGWIRTPVGGSIIHWFLRFLFYIAMWFITETLIQGAKWVYTNRKILLIIGCIAFAIMIIYFAIKYISDNY